jgi:hypothetical protein
MSIKFASSNLFKTALYNSESLNSSITFNFSILSFSLIDSSPFVLLKVIIHLLFVHSKSFSDKSFTKFLSKSSLKEISILFFSKFTKLTFFSNSYLSFISFFRLQISKRVLKESIKTGSLLTLVSDSSLIFFS